MPTLVDLFCGAGGMTAGFHLEGFDSIFAVDFDKWCVQTYNANFGGHGIQSDMREVASFPSADVVTGGPPCQGFSNLGKHLPDDPRNQLWREYMRAVKSIRPPVFIMENVPPLLKSQEYVEIRKMAERLGYQVEGRVLNTADYGVPQTRKRAIIIGNRFGAPVFPQPTHRDHRKPASELNKHLPTWRGVRDVIGDLPLEPDGHNWHIGRNPTPLSRERYRHIPPGGNRWNLPRELMPGCWIRKTQGGTDLFGRMTWHEPSFTIRTEFYKPEKGRYLHPEAHRPITIREAARIQTFPDSFDFKGSKIEVAKQIGNAVPIEFARHIAMAVSMMLEAAGVSVS